MPSVGVILDELARIRVQKRKCIVYSIISQHVKQTLIKNGIVVTMNPDREVYADGAIVVSGKEIIDIGKTDEIVHEYKADTVLDADGGIVLPGFVNTHVHVPDILYRGLSDGRSLHDWLFNIKRPLVHAMDVSDHELGAALYCREALLSGVTTFVENAGGAGSGYDRDVIDAKLSVYAEMGVRNCYAHCFLDAPSDEAVQQYIEVQTEREPAVEHVTEPLVDTDDALSTVESLIKRYNDTADGRQRVWPGPFLAWGATPEALAGAYELAETYDVMTTTHAAESPVQEGRLSSTVEYLDSADYLGERTLLGHCVQLSEADVRRVARTGTKVAHNVVTNCSLGTGIAPVPTMLGYDVTVGLGTDNIDQNDTVNPISDLRFAATVHRAARGDPTAITADDALAMATIEGARAIGRRDDLGSIEAGKLADIVVLDTDSPHLHPFGDPASMVVFQAHGTEVSTVLCNGDLVVKDGALTGDQAYLPEDKDTVLETRARLLKRTGLADRYPNDWALKMTGQSPTDG